MKISDVLRLTGQEMRDAAYQYFYPFIWLYKKIRDKIDYLKYRLGF